MTLILMGLHVFVCLFLIFVVLLQSAQAADLAGAFGGGGSQTALGMRGATTLLQKATTGAAAVFMLTSLGLGLVGREDSSLIQGLEEPAATAPATTQGADEQAGAAQDQAGAAQDQAGAAQPGTRGGSQQDRQGAQQTPADEAAPSADR